MQFLTELWLPILLSAVFVFVVSSFIHMATPLYKGDHRRLKNEDVILAALRAHGIEPGVYMFPCPGSMKEMNSPEMTDKLKRGPVGWLSILPPGGFSLGRSLVLWFIFSLIVDVLVAYVSWYALGRTAAFRPVFRIVGTAAMLAYAVGYFQDSVWKGARWSTTIKFVFDGVIYGLVTAGTFGWLWPTAT